jgi:hypothetical protein
MAPSYEAVATRPSFSCQKQQVARVIEIVYPREDTAHFRIMLDIENLKNCLDIVTVGNLKASQKLASELVPAFQLIISST